MLLTFRRDNEKDNRVAVEKVSTSNGEPTATSVHPMVMHERGGGNQAGSDDHSYSLIVSGGANGCHFLSRSIRVSVLWNLQWRSSRPKALTVSGECSLHLFQFWDLQWDSSQPKPTAVTRHLSAPPVSFWNSEPGSITKRITELRSKRYPLQWTNQPQLRFIRWLCMDVEETKTARSEIRWH